MGNLRKLLMLMLFIPFFAEAQYQNTNFDMETLGQVVTNTGFVVANEKYHNGLVDTLNRKHARLTPNVGGIAISRQMHKYSKSNTSGFDYESALYKSIARRCGNIPNRISKAIAAVKKTEWKGKAMTIIKVSELGIHTAHLCNVFYGIVCNGRIRNPYNLEGVDHNSRDGQNLLDRDERIKLALSIHDKLKRIENDLLMVEWYARYATIGNIIGSLDRETYVSLFWGEKITNDIIKQWNRLVE